MAQNEFLYPICSFYLCLFCFACVFLKVANKGVLAGNKFRLAMKLYVKMGHVKQKMVFGWKQVHVDNCSYASKWFKRSKNGFLNGNKF